MVGFIFSRSKLVELDSFTNADAVAADFDAVVAADACALHDEAGGYAQALADVDG